MMEDLHFIKDELGRIIRAERGKYFADIIWKINDADIEFCNFIVTIVCTARGVGNVRY